MLVEQHTVRAGDHRTTTLADRRAQIHDGAFDITDDLLADALTSEILADLAPGQFEFGGRVLGVV